MTSVETDAPDRRPLRGDGSLIDAREHLEEISASPSPQASAADQSPRLSYGNIYTPHAGSMIIQVQRESGLQSRTIVLSARQVKILGFLTSRAGKLLLAGSAVVVAFLVIEAARIPSLTVRITRMEHTATQLDTLEHSLAELQKRYDQVRTMMGVNTGEAGGQAPVASGPSGLAIPPGVRLARDGPAGSASESQRAAVGTGDDGGAVDNGAVPADSTAVAVHRRRRAPVSPDQPVAATPAPPTEADSGALPSPQAVPQ
jgi:hypothetical protein